MVKVTRDDFMNVRVVTDFMKGSYLRKIVELGYTCEYYYSNKDLSIFNVLHYIQIGKIKCIGDS